jgi:hypothetical protein
VLHSVARGARAGLCVRGVRGCIGPVAYGGCVGAEIKGKTNICLQ